MKILLLTNNSSSNPIYNWLEYECGEEVIKYEQKLTHDYLDEVKPELIISYGYRFIIKKDVIEKYKNRIINLHISLLPWNKGADPNIWSFLEDSPKGVTIHLIDEGVDTGDILFQKEIFFDEHKETLASTYDRLQFEIQNLFKQNWNSIRKLDFSPQKQQSVGSVHYIKDFEKIKNLLKEKGWNIPIHELKNKYKN